VGFGRVSEPLTIAIVGGLFGVLAGIPAVIGIVITSKTRRENTDQHGQSQQKLDLVARHVEVTGLKVDYLGEKVNDLSQAQNETANRLDEHMKTGDQ
jgi:hypothetical protein